MTNPTYRFAVVILAAGGSSRLGRPKQLLAFGNKTLVEHAADTALASGAAQVIVVVGAEADAVREKLSGLPVKIATNDEWSNGMGTSIRCGLGALNPEIECVVLSLCDQPHVTSDLLRDLANRQIESGVPIVASSYDGVGGVPAAFGFALFPKLSSLQGDSGARDLIRNSTIPVATVAFTGGSIDIDTPGDMENMERSLTGCEWSADS
jgi:molybdenum cofactor cytidylyltransferase